MQTGQSMWILWMEWAWGGFVFGRCGIHLFMDCLSWLRFGCNLGANSMESLYFMDTIDIDFGLFVLNQSPYEGIFVYYQTLVMPFKPLAVGSAN